MNHPSTSAAERGRIAQSQAAAATVVAVKRWQRAIEPGQRDAGEAIEVGQQMFASAGRWLVAAQLEDHSRARHGVVEVIALALSAGREVAG